MEKNEIQEAEAILLYSGTLFTYIHTYIQRRFAWLPTYQVYVCPGWAPPAAVSSCLVVRSACLRVPPSTLFGSSSLSLSAMEQVLPAFGRTLFQSIGEYYCVRHCLYVAPYSQASLPQLLHIHTYGHHSVSVASSNVRTSAL